MRFLAVFILTLCAVQITFASKTVHAQGLKMMPNYYYEIDILRPVNGSPGDFIIRLDSPAAMTGCFSTNPADIEMIDAGAVMFVKLEEGDIEINKPTNYNQFGCEMNSGTQHIDLKLNKNDLEQSGTNKIAISNKNVGKLFDIELDIQDNKIIFDSELKSGARVSREKAEQTFTHWFYPVNTILVFANGMQKDPEIRKQAKIAAASRGFTELDIMLKGFESPDDYLYFVDTKNILGDTLDDRTPIVIGTITTSETYQGADGPYEKRSKQSVFARRPLPND